MKKFVCVVVILAISMAMLTTVSYAAEPRWNNVASISPSISALDGCYTCAIAGLSGTTKINCTMILYEKTWLGTYKEVSRTSEVYNDRMHEFVGYYAIREGTHYKLDITAIVTCNGSDETVSCTFEK